MKKLASLLLVVCLVLAMTACGSSSSSSSSNTPAEDATFDLKCSTYLTANDSLYPMMEEFVTTVSEKTDGHVNITLYPGEQLGGFEQTFEETIRGTIEFGFNAVPSSYDDRIESTFIPGAFATYENLEKFAAPGSTVYNAYEAALADQGVTMLGFFISGYNNVCLNGDLPEGYADPSVQKDTVVRVPSGAEIFDDIMLALGYRTAALSGVETYSGLQTGVVEGTIGQPNSMILSGYSDVITNIIDTQLIASIDPIFINSEVFNSMPAEYQQVLRDCAAEFYTNNVQFLIEEDAAIEAALAEKGIQVVHISDDERAAIVETMKETIWPELEEKFGAEFMQGVEADVAG